MPVHWLYRWIEKIAIKQASKIITTTQACAEFYLKLYPKYPQKNMHVIPNGFAKEFHDKRNIKKTTHNPAPYILLHSGILYQIGRNPEVLLKAIHLLVSQGAITEGQFILRFRGANPWPALIAQINALGLTSYIEFKGRISYTEAIDEMNAVNANVLIQNSLFNLQIPSKLYDILALKKPLLAITDSQGALAKEMTSLNLPYFCNTIEETATFLTKLMNENQSPLTDSALLCRNRQTMNKELSQILCNVPN
jgi:glycosyltransferase involved in cell wall biosynthesis